MLLVSLLSIIIIRHRHKHEYSPTETENKKDVRASIWEDLRGHSQKAWVMGPRFSSFPPILPHSEYSLSIIPGGSEGLRLLEVILLINIRDFQSFPPIWSSDGDPHVSVPSLVPWLSLVVLRISALRQNNSFSSWLRRYWRSLNGHGKST